MILVQVYTQHNVLIAQREFGADEDYRPWVNRVAGSYDNYFTWERELSN